ncbi:hypothetical protein CDL15_Pgr011213 [Punica granatum]|uniref:Pectinesterase inhibitor domain-containing protein n=1 Tax=Punica granatum TaxID=22663 RepID=A0A218WEH4_PUNGR|nr:hypothetical protein CDL15_Pgr011213 [Punica granatum]
MIYLSRSDPRSATADPTGLAKISLDILLSKANATLREAIKLYTGTGAEPIVYQYYGACIDVYIVSVVKLLPNASTDLGTGKFSEARGDVTQVVNYAEGCAQQFAGRSDPLVPWTTGVHDFGTVAADIIGSLG